MRVYLPAYRMPVRVQVAAPAVTAVTAPRAAGGGETILVVEDEDGLRRMLMQLLRGRGYNVLAAGRPDDALALSGQHQNSIDLLITDVVMPGMHGPTLAAKLLSQRPTLRVLFISGYAEHELPQHAFLKKPFAPEALARKVRMVLDESRNGAVAATANARV